MVTDRQLIITAVLQEHFYLARTFKSGKTVTFLVLDDREPGHIVAQFEWSLSFYWSNFGYGRPGGCCLSDIWVRFCTTVSCDASYVIIVGPAEESGETRRKSIPTTKILYCDTWTVEVATACGSLTNVVLNKNNHLFNSIFSQ